MAADLDAVYDGNTGQLDVAYRRGVTAALPVEPSDRFWRELTATVATRIISHQNRAARSASAVKRWQRLDAATAAYGAALRDLNRRTRWDDADPMLLNRALEHATKISKLAERKLAAISTINENFRHKQNPANEAFYGTVLDLWTRELGQSLGVAGRAAGPSVRFFRACVCPLIPLTADGIASIIRKHKRRRSVFASEK